MRVLLVIWLCCVALFANGEMPNSKVIYLKLLNQEALKKTEFYVGQKIEVKYSLLLLDGASFLNSGFVYADEKQATKLQLLNPRSTWKKQADGTYVNTFIYQIKDLKFFIPTLEVSALSKDRQYQDVAKVEGFELEAIKLGGERYSGVLARDLRVVQFKSESTDDGKNILVVFQMQAKDSNLAEFHLPSIQEQGFKEKMKNSKGVQEGIYYCVVPNTQTQLRFTYFNLDQLSYEEIAFAVSGERKATVIQDELDPRANFWTIKHFALIFLITVSLLGALIYRKRKIMRWVLLVFSLFFILCLCYVLFVTETIRVKQDALIRILPMHHATLLQKLSSPLEVEKLGEYQDFYQIKFEDSKIGWVKKEDCE